MGSVLFLSYTPIQCFSRGQEVSGSNTTSGRLKTTGLLSDHCVCLPEKGSRHTHPPRTRVPGKSLDVRWSDRDEFDPEKDSEGSSTRTT